MKLFAAAGAVKCQAQQGQQLAKKAAAAVASLPAMLAASPAFALVREVGIQWGFSSRGALAAGGLVDHRMAEQCLGQDGSALMQGLQQAISSRKPRINSRAW